MEKTRVVCDYCEREIERTSKWKTPCGWFRLENIKLLFRKSDEKPRIPDHNILNIANGTVLADPDFCSRKCLVKWISKKAKEIKEAEECTDSDSDDSDEYEEVFD